ncbi:MAG: hypothetical protein DRR11_19185, partial [Gammaproteobacteria bacterium]
RHGYIYRNGNHWTQKHIAWLRTLEFAEPMLTSVFGNYFGLIRLMRRWSCIKKDMALHFMEKSER